MTQERLNITIPPGRFVSGSLTEKRTKDLDGRPIEPEKQRYEFGIAVRKDDPNLLPVIQAIAAHAKAGYSNAPHIQTRIDDWFNTMSGFSMKISDGDKPNAKGVQNQNTVGHFVFWFSTALDVKTCVSPTNAQIDPTGIKRGWYVDVFASVASNGLQDRNAGIYLNPEWVRLLGEGDEIVGGLSAEEAFGSAAPAALPPGARPIGSTPQAPASAGMPGGGMPGASANPTPAQAHVQTAPAGMPGAGMPGGGMPGAQQPTASPGDQMPQTNHPSHPGILGTGLPGQNQ